MVTMTGQGERWRQAMSDYLDTEHSSRAAQHSVHPTGGSLRVFGQFAWLEAGSGKVALSRPA